MLVVEIFARVGIEPTTYDAEANSSASNGRRCFVTLSPKRNKKSFPFTFKA